MNVIAHEFHGYNFCCFWRLTYTTLYSLRAVLLGIITTATAVAWLRCSSASICLFVCLSVYFLHDISKTDAASITKLDVDMDHDEY